MITHISRSLQLWFGQLTEPGRIRRLPFRKTTSAFDILSNYVLSCLFGQSCTQLCSGFTPRSALRNHSGDVMWYQRLTPRLALCKASALPPALSLQLLWIFFLFISWTWWCLGLTHDSVLRDYSVLCLGAELLGVTFTVYTVFWTSRLNTAPL